MKLRSISELHPVDYSDGRVAFLGQDCESDEDWRGYRAEGGSKGVKQFLQRLVQDFGLLSRRHAAPSYEPAIEAPVGMQSL